VRLAVLSDIHGNLEALEAVLDHVEGQSVDQVVCLGDIVGYGADPNLCLDRIRQVARKAVAGNHDYAAVGLTDPSGFNRPAREAIRWTSPMLLHDHRRYLEGLPLTLTIPEVEATLVHATPSRPEDWYYLFSRVDAVEEFGAFKTLCCFVGHTHLPVVFVEGPGGDVSAGDMDRLQLEEGYRYLINVGSVGQPRDGDPRSAYIVVDWEASMCRLHRVEYDFRKTQNKILQAGLPPILAERLAHGR
jgi:predicted phosphodiesterase